MKAEEIRGFYDVQGDSVALAVANPAARDGQGLFAVKYLSRNGRGDATVWFNDKAAWAMYSWLGEYLQECHCSACMATRARRAKGEEAK